VSGWLVIGPLVSGWLVSGSLAIGSVASGACAKLRACPASSYPWTTASPCAWRR
jgi:hypothetical protein